MTQKTAVEFMVEELNKSIGLTKFVDTCDDDFKQEILGIIEQAKAIEKEQKMQDYSVGYSNGQVGSNRTAEQYYNDTFNK